MMNFEMLKSQNRLKYKFKYLFCKFLNKNSLVMYNIFFNFRSSIRIMTADFTAGGGVCGVRSCVLLCYGRSGDGG
jgi:hypothetical protein